MDEDFEGKLEDIEDKKKEDGSERLENAAGK